MKFEIRNLNLEPTPKSQNKIFTAKTRRDKEHKFNYLFFRVFASKQ